jgi:hypothetical protein
MKNDKTLSGDVTMDSIKIKFLQLKNPKSIIDRLGHYDKEKSHSRNCLDFLNEMEDNNRMVELLEEIKKAE